MPAQMAFFGSRHFALLTVDRNLSRDGRAMEEQMVSAT
jgi:hypothetical protein